MAGVAQTLGQLMKRYTEYIEENGRKSVDMVRLA